MFMRSLHNMLNLSCLGGTTTRKIHPPHNSYLSTSNLKQKTQYNTPIFHGTKWPKLASFGIESSPVFGRDSDGAGYKEISEA